MKASARGGLRITLAVSKAGGQRVTQTGLSLGTPQYMSPEQATGDRAIDGRDSPRYPAAEERMRFDDVDRRREGTQRMRRLDFPGHLALEYRPETY